MAVIGLTFSQPDICSVAVDGKNYVLPEDQQALVTALKDQASKFKYARVDGDYNTVPYKCFGSAVFLAQSAGFERVGFIAAPPPADPEH